jgi:hypothetical protein
MKSFRSRALTLFGLGLTVLSLVPAGHAQSETSVAEVLAGSAAPVSLKLKELTPEWRRISVTGETMLGMGGMFQSMMQTVGSMLGSGGAEAIYTRGATLRIGGEQFLVGYRLAGAGIDFGALMSMGAAAARAGGQGGAPPPMERKPVTPDSELSLVLINVRSIATLGEIRPFDLAEATKPAAPGLLDLLGGMNEKAAASDGMSDATSNMKQLATGMMMYMQDYDEVLPPMPDAEKLKKVVLPYVKNEGVFKSPATRQAFRPNPRLSGRKLASLGNPAGVIMLYSAAPEPDGTRLVARADGSVRSVSADEWPKVAQAQRLPPD